MILPIYNTEPVFNPVLEGLCTQNCVQQILNYYGIKDAFKYMDTALNAKLFKLVNQENECDLEIKDCLVQKEYQKNLIKFKDKDADSSLVYEENRKTLESGLPVIVDLDLYEMEYSKTYQIYHNKHSAILCGYEKENPLLIDSYQWQFKGEVLLEQYLKARNSICPFDNSPFSGTPIVNSWCVVKQDGWNGELDELLHNTLQETLTDYYETSYRQEDSIAMGVNAFKVLTDLMISWKERDSETRIRNLKHIRRLALYMKSQLMLFRFYIAEASERLKLKESQKVIDELDYSITVWGSFTILIMKALYNDTLSFYEKIVKRFADLVETEEERYKSLKELSKII